MDQHNAALLQLTMARCNAKEAAANTLLMGQVRVARRKNKGMQNTMVAYRYLRRSVGHFYGTLGAAATKAFLAGNFELKGIGRLVPVPGSPRRTMNEVNMAEALHLLSGDRFLHESFGHLALLDAMAVIFFLLEAGEVLITYCGPQQGVRVVSCLLAHFAFCVTKVREHLKLRCGSAVTAPGGNGGFNEGHRVPWMSELELLDGLMWRRNETNNGIRLLDGTSSTRAVVADLVTPLFPPAGIHIPVGGGTGAAEEGGAGGEVAGESGNAAGGGIGTVEGVGGGAVDAVGGPVGGGPVGGGPLGAAGGPVGGGAVAAVGGPMIGGAASTAGRPMVG